MLLFCKYLSTIIFLCMLLIHRPILDVLDISDNYNMRKWETNNLNWTPQRCLAYTPLRAQSAAGWIATRLTFHIPHFIDTQYTHSACQEPTCLPQVYPIEVGSRMTIFPRCKPAMLNCHWLSRQRVVNSFFCSRKSLRIIVLLIKWSNSAF